jgi:uncharacterized protein (DUF1501 family)
MTKLECNRRNFLRGALGAGSALAAFGGGFGREAQLAHAAQREESDTYYVFCYFGGGWDILLGLDPRDPVQFGSSNMRQTRIQAGYEYLPGNRNLIRSGFGTEFGPYIGRLQNYADRMAVVRGMSMETVSHGVGRNRFITGRQPMGNMAAGSSGATWLAAEWGHKEIIPNLALNVASFNVDQPTYATGFAANQVGDLLSSLEPSGGDLVEDQRLLLNRFLDRQSACDAAKLSPTLQTAEIARKSAREIASGALARKFDFSAETPEMEALRDRFRLNGGMMGGGRARGALAAQALTGGVSRVVSMSVTGGLDTHGGAAWIGNQGPRQQEGFNVIADLADELSAKEYKDTGDNWLDHTVIVAFSEFSRTPLLNGNMGRDHHITNACMMLGGGLKPGVYGKASDVGLRPQPMNLKTGEVDYENGVVPKPDHIYQTLFYHAGFQRDDAELGVGPIDAMFDT